MWSLSRDFSWLARTSPHTHGRMFCVSAGMCLICLLATFRIGLRTPITFLRLDLNYIIVFNYTSSKLDPRLLSLFFFKKTTPSMNLGLLPRLNLEPVPCADQEGKGVQTLPGKSQVR